MPVCRFYLENRCRFGDSCRYEHPRGGAQQNLFGGPPRDNSWQGGGGQRVTFRDSFGAGGQGGNNQYKWVANQQGNQAQGIQQPSVLELVDALPRDMETWEKSKMWPFSCVAVEKELPSLPEFHDVSAEELRFEAYEAMKSGNMLPYTQKFQSLINEFRNKRMQLKHMTMDLKSKLVTITEEARKKKVSQLGSAGSSTFGSTQPAQSLFGQGSSLTSSSVFGQSSSGMGSGNSGLFGKPTSSTPFGSSPLSGGLFGSGSASTMASGTSGSAFGNQGSALFGKPAGAGSVFGNQPQTQTPQVTNPFGLANPSSPSSSSGLFGQTANQGQPAPGLFSSGSATAASQQSPFGSAVPSSSQGLFGKPAPGFGDAGSTPSVFGNSSAATTQTATAFGGPPPSIFGNAAAGQSQQPATLFGKPVVSAGPAPSQNPFGSMNPAQGQPQGQVSGLFGRGPPAQGASFASPSPFGSSTSGAGASASIVYSNLYTPLADLTDFEKEAFSAKAFELGKIPLRPPPKEMINV